MTDNQTFAGFTESLTVELPQIDDVMREFVESAKSSSHGLIVEIAAIHEGLTANFNYYSKSALESGLESWTHPYPKPIILNHDINVDPVGRVMNASMESEADDSNYTKLQIAVTDPEAIAKVMDQRYLTGSVGGKSNKANCSICGKDWAEASLFNLPCKHVRGKTYKGKLSYLEREDLSFHEYSFVNAPADKRSMVKSMSINQAEESEWLTSARFFDLNMNKQSILEYSENASKDILSLVRKKEATPIYHQLKGSFLSALAAEESDEKESVKNMADLDVLEVTEQLSNDLASNAEEAEEKNCEKCGKALENESEGTVCAGCEEAADEQEAAADAEDNTEATDAEDAAAEEASEDAEEATDEDAEEAKKKGKKVKCSDCGDTIAMSDDEKKKKCPKCGAMVNSESDSEDESEDADEENSEEAETPGQETARGADAATATDARPNTTSDTAADKGTRDYDVTRDAEEKPQNTNQELSETHEDENAERPVEEMEQELQTLREENARLKSALHRTLAERVVDTKIALGLLKAEERDEQLTEHADRTASSLADSLRDLAGMSRTPGASTIDVIKPKSVVTADEANAETVGATQEETVEDPLATAENLFVDVLMNRRKL